MMPKNHDWMDYDQVNELLGSYIVDECFIVPGGEENIDCLFDLRGDMVFFIGTHLNYLRGDLVKGCLHL